MQGAIPPLLLLSGGGEDGLKGLPIDILKISNLQKISEKKLFFGVWINTPTKIW